MKYNRARKISTTKGYEPTRVATTKGIFFPNIEKKTNDLHNGTGPEINHFLPLLYAQVKFFKQ